MDPYKILGIDKDASREEIKRAYRSKAKKYHPDAGGDAWVFQQIQNAYRELTGDKREKTKKSSPNSDPAQKESQHPTSSFEIKTGKQNTSTRRKKTMKLSNEVAGIIGGALLALIVGALIWVWMGNTPRDETASIDSQNQGDTSVLKIGANGTDRPQSQSNSKRLEDLSRDEVSVVPPRHSPKEAIDDDVNEGDDELEISNVQENPEAIPPTRKAPAEKKNPEPLEPSLAFDPSTMDFLGPESIEAPPVGTGTLVRLQPGAMLNGQPSEFVVDIPDWLQGANFFRFSRRYPDTTDVTVRSPGTFILAIPANARRKHELGFNEATDEEDLISDSWHLLDHELSCANSDGIVRWKIFAKSFNTPTQFQLRLNDSDSPILVLSAETPANNNLDLFLELQCLEDKFDIANSEPLDLNRRNAIGAWARDFIKTFSGKRIEVVFCLQDITPIQRGVYRANFQSIETDFYTDFRRPLEIASNQLMRWSSKDVEKLGVGSRISVKGNLYLSVEGVDEIDFSRQQQYMRLFTKNFVPEQLPRFSISFAIRNPTVKILEDAPARDDNVQTIPSPFGDIIIKGGPPADQLETTVDEDGTIRQKLKK